MIKNNLLILHAGATEKNYWLDLWRYRELFSVLAWRDISVRYKQTLIGLSWALLQPLLTLLILTFIFGKLANFQARDDIPYALTVYAGLLPWQLFSTSLMGASNSIVGNSNLISKVYFPRLIVPISSMVVCLLDFLISFIILLGLLLYFKFLPSWHIFTLPFFVFMAILSSLGPGLLITALNVKYRDFRYVIPFLMQFGLYASPVGFNSSVVPEQWRFLYSLNPMVGVIDGFRWAILGGNSPIYLPGFLLSWGVISLFLWMGVKQFRRMEKGFADIL